MHGTRMIFPNATVWGIYLGAPNLSFAVSLLWPWVFGWWRCGARWFPGVCLVCFVCFGARFGWLAGVVGAAVVVWLFGVCLLVCFGVWGSRVGDLLHRRVARAAW